MNDFANRIVLITGAGQGIGRQLALQLAAEGAAIAGIDVNAEALKALSGELAGKRFAWAVADVTDRTALLLAASELEKQLGPVDVLIVRAKLIVARLDLEPVHERVRPNVVENARLIAHLHGYRTGFIRVPDHVRRQDHQQFGSL